MYIVTGVLATVVSFFILLSRKRSRMIGIKLADDVLWSANYLFKGAVAFTGCAQNAIAIIRELIFYFRGKKKWASSPVWLWAFLLFFATMPLYTWAGWHSLLPAAASILSTLGFYFKNPHHTRIINLFVQSMMIAYAAIVTNRFALVSSAVTLLSAVIGLIVDYRVKKRIQNKPQPLDAG
ncbi:MAG: YgjV family protein [Oscillospiraceae bacterium]|nr:YgjV family protein [Oscillospiraceae bacterium]